MILVKYWWSSRLWVSWNLVICNQQLLHNYLYHNVARSSNLLHFQWNFDCPCNERLTVNRKRLLSFSNFVNYMNFTIREVDILKSSPFYWLGCFLVVLIKITKEQEQERLRFTALVILGLTIREIGEKNRWKLSQFTFSFRREVGVREKRNSQMGET